MQQGFLTILMWVVIFGVLWFFLIRPQRKQQKEHDEMIENLEVGDRVVTIGGIRGKIINIKENNIRLRISSNVDIDLIRDSIGRIDQENQPEEKKIKGEKEEEKKEKDDE
ncbi:MAG TPA: preprotein translocase subunit YajC [Halanaerobiales bacterium]|nr:preprotein translocase subunit YajC [Halanaerobiales bacterium]